MREFDIFNPGSPRSGCKGVCVEVAAAAAFFASDKANFITGTTLDIDGGQTKGV